jgi:tRNA (cmo5U34)-methyltransferase
VNDRDHFDQAAPNYDRGCRRSMPDPEAFYGAVVEGLPFGRDEELRVLDLGAGTGLLSATVAEKFPAARITLVDFSVEMLRMARRRFEGHPGRFEFRVMDYAREPLPGRTRGFDLVVSALSLHHLTHGEKRETFEKVYASLASGGRFVNADRVQGGTPEAERDHHEHRPHRAPEAELSEEGPTARAPHMKAVEEATLQEQMAWLREVGFEEVECYYENNRFAVYGGRKG